MSTKYVLLYESAEDVLAKAPVHFAAHSARGQEFHCPEPRRRRLRPTRRGDEDVGGDFDEGGQGRVVVVTAPHELGL